MRANFDSFAPRDLAEQVFEMSTSFAGRCSSTADVLTTVTLISSL